MSGFKITEPGGVVYDYAAQQRKKLEKARRRFDATKAAVLRLDDEIRLIVNDLTELVSKFHTSMMGWDDLLQKTRPLEEKRAALWIERCRQRTLALEMHLSNPALGELPDTINDVPLFASIDKRHVVVGDN